MTDQSEFAASVQLQGQGGRRQDISCVDQTEVVHRCTYIHGDLGCTIVMPLCSSWTIRVVKVGSVWSTNKNR